MTCTSGTPIEQGLFRLLPFHNGVDSGFVMVPLHLCLIPYMHLFPDSYSPFQTDPSSAHDRSKCASLSTRVFFSLPCLFCSSHANVPTPALPGPHLQLHGPHKGQPPAVHRQPQCGKAFGARGIEVGARSAAAREWCFRKGLTVHKSALDVQSLSVHASC